jgi:D-tyrosyl-tRNA(Tyr) deacylase
MRVFVQRVNKAKVSINNNLHSEIGKGLLVLLGIGNNDSEDDIQWLADKIVKLRIFDDPNGVMNLSVLDVGADILLISQFTLLASTKKGARPSYTKAAKPDTAELMYEKFIERTAEKLGKLPYTGKFGADMQISLVNDGPVSLFIDSKLRE